MQVEQGDDGREVDGARLSRQHAHRQLAQQVGAHGARRLVLVRQDQEQRVQEVGQEVGGEVDAGELPGGGDKSFFLSLAIQVIYSRSIKYYNLVCNKSMGGLVMDMTLCFFINLGKIFTKMVEH